MSTFSTESIPQASNSGREEQPLAAEQLGRELGGALAAEHRRVNGKAWAQHNYLIIHAARIWEWQGVWQVGVDDDRAAFVQGFVSGYNVDCQ
jgi:hypothetical protein